MMLDLSTENAVERLPIVGSQSDKECVLRVPKLPNKTGEATANAVYDTLNEYDLLEMVQVVCTDTEKTNTGIRNGAVALLEKRLKRTLMYLACRHHVYEVILRAVFVAKCSDSKTRSPNVEIFTRSKNQWNEINTEMYRSGLEDSIVEIDINPEFAQDMIEFCLHNLEKPQCRADYREFLELVVIFLGGHLPGGFKMKKVGAIHHARWMSKAIGALKLFLLRDQFEFKNDENEYIGIRAFCIFLVRIYVKAWFQATFAIKAPRLDLDFIKDSIDYANVDKEISNVILSKMSGHLWYLSEEAVGFAFFDDEVALDEKIRMVSALYNERTSQKVLQSSERELKTTYKAKQIHDFISINTNKFFDRFGIPNGFLLVDPSQWNENEEYKKGLEICEKVHAVNDAAERAVKLFSHYNQILCKNEEEKQFIIKVIQDYRTKYPSINKAQLA